MSGRKNTFHSLEVVATTSKLEVGLPGYASLSAKPDL